MVLESGKMLTLYGILKDVGNAAIGTMLTFPVSSEVHLWAQLCLFEPFQFP